MQSRIKASAGPGAVAKMRAPDKLLKDAFCISLKIKIFHFRQIAGPKNCGPGCCSTPSIPLDAAF